jgi:hypothetical protein
MPMLIAYALLRRWIVRGQMRQRERSNWMDETREMPFVPQNENTDFQEKAKELVIETILDRMHIDVPPTKPMFYVYVVWFCKTLQNWKVLISTSIDDGRYYEVTYNGDLRETYVDTYVKVDNRKFLDSEV